MLTYWSCWRICYCRHLFFYQFSTTDFRCQDRSEYQQPNDTKRNDWCLQTPWEDDSREDKSYYLYQMLAAKRELCFIFPLIIQLQIIITLKKARKFNKYTVCVRSRFLCFNAKSFLTFVDIVTYWLPAPKRPYPLPASLSSSFEK